jgi:hypothetical protein
VNYFETHGSEEQNILAFRENCAKQFRQCCTEENSTLLSDFMKNLCYEKGIRTLRRICPEWTIVLSQFDCFVIEAKVGQLQSMQQH